MHNSQIKIVPTEHARHFFESTLLPAKVKILIDVAEWSMWQKRGDPVLHIDLGKWADLLLIAPLSANTLAKIATVRTIVYSSHCLPN